MRRVVRRSRTHGLSLPNLNEGGMKANSTFSLLQSENAVTAALDGCSFATRTKAATDAYRCSSAEPVVIRSAVRFGFIVFFFSFTSYCGVIGAEV